MHQGRATEYRVNAAALQPSLALLASEVCAIARYTSHSQVLPRSKPPVVNCTGRCFNDCSGHGKCVVRLSLAVRCHPCSDDCVSHRALISFTLCRTCAGSRRLVNHLSHLLQSTCQENRIEMGLSAVVCACRI